MELWEKFTGASGGCVISAKSWQTLVDFSWHEGKWKYNKNIDEFSIGINDAAGKCMNLVQLAANEAQKILGVWMALNINNER